MGTPCKKTGNECFGDKEFNLLYEISILLNKVKRDLNNNIEPVIQLLANHLQAEKVLLTILNRENKKISIAVSYGLTTEEQERGIYNIGEGIIEKVVETGKPVVITNIKKEKTFLNKTGSSSHKEDISFICVPILEENEIVGTLSLHRHYNQYITISDDTRILSIVGSMIAQAVKTRQEYAEEIALLKQENEKLHTELKAHSKPEKIIGNTKELGNPYSKKLPK